MYMLFIYFQAQFGRESLVLETLGDFQAPNFFSMNATGAVSVAQLLNTTSTDVYYVST